jgi:hypothetical protein
MDALKLVMIYERLEFFYKMFDNGINTTPEEQQEMVNEWLHGKLNGQYEKDILPERFGQLIYDETKKLM